ncbi:MAG: hypothetical protein N2202_09055 [Proteobacteria bacterium]|nr:hypothetical protein [Pseudomonadota bacterium]
MTEALIKNLIFHGAVIISIGLLAGLIYWQTITRDKKPEIIHGWRIAHAFLVIEGIFIIVMGLSIPNLSFSKPVLKILVWIITISGYGFVLAFIGGAWSGYRGLKPKPYGINTILFLGHFIGASGSIIGIAIIIYGALNSL